MARRVAVVNLWCGARRVCTLGDTGRPTHDLLKAAGLRFAGAWAKGSRYALNDFVTHAGQGYRRDTDAGAPAPGQGAGWVAVDESSLLELVADRYVAINGGVRPVVRVVEAAASRPRSGVGWDHGPAGSLP